MGSGGFAGTAEESRKVLMLELLCSFSVARKVQMSYVIESSYLEK